MSVNKCARCGKMLDINTYAIVCDDCKPSYMAERDMIAKKDAEQLAKLTVIEDQLKADKAKQKTDKIYEIMKINVLLERIKNGEKISKCSLTAGEANFRA